MTHIDDVLDAKTLPPFVHEFLEHARRPAMLKDQDWLTANRPTVTWRGGRFVCVGASRMGDVWLKEFNLTPAFYDHRVDVAELTDWAAPYSASNRDGAA